MEITLKQPVTFRKCRLHLNQCFHFLCQEDGFLAEHAIDLLPGGRVRSTKVHLDVIRDPDQFTLVTVGRKVVESKAKTIPFELSACPYNLSINRDTFQNLENHGSAGQQVYTPADQRIARTVNEKILTGRTGDHR